MDAGRLDHRVTFSRRATIPDQAGNQRGAFAPLLTVWANFRRIGGAEAVEGGRLQDVGHGVLRIRDSGAARGITADDRALVRGRDYRIVSVAPPDRRTGLIEIAVASSAAG